MPERVREVMTGDPVAVTASASVADAARVMRDRDIGGVVVRDEEDGGVLGILTDRDIVVRALADRPDGGRTAVGEVCSRDLATVTPDDPVAKVVRIMQERDVRRVPVTDNGELVGIVSLGDLAVDRDPESTLADISSAPPNE